MDRNPEADHLDSISQRINSFTMDPSDQTITPKPEQQNTKEYAAKIALEKSLPDTETIPTVLVSGSQQVGTRRILPEILFQIIDYLDFSDDLPTIICVALTAKVCYDYVTTRRRLEHLKQGGEEPEEGCYFRGRTSRWDLDLGQRLELAPLLEDWVGSDYRTASPKTITALCLTSRASEYMETPNVLFLSRAVYDDTWEQEFVLPQRHMDYYNMTMPFKYNFVPHTPYFPPPLRNKVDWYEDMAHFIIHEYIMGEWNEESHNDIGGWFDPGRIVYTPPYHPLGLCEARRQFWLEYMHSSLRDWVYHRGPSEFKGKGDGSNFIVSIEDGVVITAYDRREKPLEWTYNGRDNFHRAICRQEGATSKDMLKAIERDINESWGISFWETHSTPPEMNQFTMDICNQMTIATSEQDAVADQKVGDMNYHNKRSMTVDAGMSPVATTDLDLNPSSQYDQKRIVPPEIVYKILDILYEKHDMPTIWCIALSACIYYDYVAKFRNRFGIRLTTEEKKKLAPLLKNWMGDQYRIMRSKTIDTIDSALLFENNTMFLSRKIYGDKIAKERALCQRFEDYGNFIGPLRWPPSRPAFYNDLHIPDPTRKGTAWYEEMAKYLLLYIIQNWDKGSGKPIGSWFESRESPEYPARQHFWQEYLHSSLRAWVHHEGEEFGGKPSQKEVLRTEPGHYNLPYSMKPNWTYSGFDNLHRGQYIQEGKSKEEVMQMIPDHNILRWLMHHDGESWVIKAICFPKETSMKEVLRTFERDIEESWGPLD
ncbi:uncharacterized protein Bfra_004073 [Botrytis fragariae]|uniref:Uncharacterized protein n=1 Tax=Botrytis fragariae TaxID=1964551 RepID=A0A8H6EJ22_9HELO|nr:uncharacterized protein Bfra_004073 [Botrytis fragariae]KAF5874066.1 hypothetical protein Bfra_004073 [Botrytis fragariae]